MSKTTPEEALQRATKHRINLMYSSDFVKLAALIDEVRGVDAEPVHWRAVLAAHQVSKRPIIDLHVVGFKERRLAESWIAEQKDFGGWEYTLEPLYTRPAPSQPAAPVELPVVACISAYAIPVSDRPYSDEILVQRARQIEGPPLWAVRLNGDCLNKSGEWEWEPMPSSRDDEFLERCRFPSAQEAIQAAIAAGRKAS